MTATADMKEYSCTACPDGMEGSGESCTGTSLCLYLAMKRYARRAHFCHDIVTIASSTMDFNYGNAIVHGRHVGMLQYLCCCCISLCQTSMSACVPLETHCDTAAARNVATRTAATSVAV